jgi:DNA-directed RNA polymerase subunit RPC12/RpoP
MNEQQRAELERIRDVLYPATGLEDYDEEIIGRVLKDINALLAQDALYKMAEDAVTIGLSYNDWPKIGCVNHDCDQCKAAQEPVARYCCHSCFKASGGVMLDRMILCPECGNKRCPKASDHNFSCTGSNEPGQWGSIYTTPPTPQPVPVKTYHDGKPWPVAPKPWVGLTDEDVAVVLTGDASLANRLDELTPSWVELTRAIEAKLKEKNT